MKNILLIIGMTYLILAGCCKDGEDGEDGLDGENGYVSLIDIQSEPAGVNCTNGGYIINSGLDMNSNSILDGSEVLSTSYLCSASLGQTVTGFQKDSVYKAETDGLLNVMIYRTGGGGGISNGTFIYSDSTNNPVTLVGSLSALPSSTVVPIQKDKYWKVSISANDYYTSLSINWIPVQN